MTLWSFSYNSFVKLPLYNAIHLYQYIPKYPKHSVIEGLHCRYDLDGQKKYTFWGITGQIYQTT